MENMLAYIFGNLKHSNDAIVEIKKCLKHQYKFNKSTVIFAGFSAMYMIMLNKSRIDQEKKIEELAKEIEELKQTKGE